MSSCEVKAFYKQLQKDAKNGKKWCYDCENYYEVFFGGYESSNCIVVGSLDIDQKIYHPDKSADVCKQYRQKDGKRWYEQ